MIIERQYSIIYKIFQKSCNVFVNALVLISRKQKQQVQGRKER